MSCIFDLDGTLLDSENLSSQAINLVLQPYKVKMEWSTNKKTLGLKKEIWTKIVIEDLNLAGILEPEALAIGWESNLKELYPVSKLMEGALTIVKLCKELKIKVGLATSSTREQVNEKRKYHVELFSLFDAIVCGDEVEKGKPFPDIYLQAAKLLGTEAKRCIAFEDALSGVKSSHAAGMYVVAIPDQRLDVSPFLPFASKVIKSLNEFDEECFRAFLSAL